MAGGFPAPNYRGTVLIVSHDRDLLDTAAEFILHLEHGKLTLYTGGYNTFVATRTAKRALDDTAFAKKQEAAREHMQAFVDRFKAKASKARQAQSRMKMLAKMQTIEVPVDEHVAPIRIPAAGRGQPAAHHHAQRASVGYEPGKPILTAYVDALRSRRPHRASGQERQRQIHLGEIAGGQASADGWRAGAGAQMGAGLFRPASSWKSWTRPLTPIETLSQLRRQSADGTGARPIGRVRLFARTRATTKVEKSVGRRTRAVDAGARHIGQAQHADPGRTHQPSRHRRAQRTAECAERFRRRGDPGQP